MKKKVNLKLEKEENNLRKRIKVHDSIFKELLDDKEDFRDFIVDFSQYDLDRTVAKKFTSIAPVNGAEGGEAVE